MQFEKPELHGTDFRGFVTNAGSDSRHSRVLGGELDGQYVLRSELQGRARRPELHGVPVRLPVELPDRSSGVPR